jgi:hypothetical protein
LKQAAHAHANTLLQNPFGDAKPREKVLATRTGKSETEILKEEVKAEKPKVGANSTATAAAVSGPLTATSAVSSNSVLLSVAVMQ